MTSRTRASIALVSHGTSEFDSRIQRMARTLTAGGDRVTIYCRVRAGWPETEQVDGYRIVRLPLADADLPPEASAAEAAARRGPGRRVAATIGDLAGRAYRVVRKPLYRSTIAKRFRLFPGDALEAARRFAASDLVEPHDIWHGMWAGSLPAIERLRARHGGRTVYDARDVYLRSRSFDAMPRWQRWVMTWFERRWARSADAVITVSEPYAAMMARDLGIRDIPVVRNCPDRWDPPSPRPDRIRGLLGIPASTSVVLYQGLLIRERGIEEAMDAILDVPDAVLVLMGFGDHRAGNDRRRGYDARARTPGYAGKVHVIDAVPPAELLSWTASADVLVMLYQPDTENHQFVTPQKLWEAMAAGVPVVASDLPGMAPIVTGTGCGVVCDPTSPVAIAAAIRGLLAEGPEALRARGDRGLAAAHETYNWATQLEVLDSVYARLLDGPAGATP